MRKRARRFGSKTAVDSVPLKIDSGRARFSGVDLTRLSGAALAAWRALGRPADLLRIAIHDSEPVVRAVWRQGRRVA